MPGGGAEVASCTTFEATDWALPATEALASAWLEMTVPTGGAACAAAQKASATAPSARARRAVRRAVVSKPAVFTFVLAFALFSLPPRREGARKRGVRLPAPRAKSPGRRKADPTNRVE